VSDGRLETDADWTVVTTRVRAGASIGSGAVILCGVTIGRGAGGDPDPKGIAQARAGAR
jgi:acetyltransferase-like isoleucine patch superfamily enzyme